MAKDIQTIKSQFQVIQNETIESANTASRVGGAGYDLAEYVGENRTGIIPYFNTEAELNASRPNPSNGEQAWVGTPYPGTVWNVVDGVWTDTTVVPDVNTVDLSGYLLTGGTTKTGAQLDAEIAQLDADISNKSDKTDIFNYVYTSLGSIFLQGAFTKTAVTAGTGDGLLYMRTSKSNNTMFNIQNGKNHYFTGEIGHSTYCGVLYFTAAFGFISYECGDVQVYSRKLLTIPPNAVYIASCSLGGNPIIETLDVISKFTDKVDKSSIKDSFGTSTTDVVNQKKVTEALYENVSEVLPFYSGFANNSAFNDNGSITDGGNATGYYRSSASLSGMIPVTAGDRITYTGDIRHDEFAGVIFKNGSNSVVGNACSDTKVYTDEAFTVPAGASYMASCSYGVQPILKRLTSELKTKLLGDTIKGVTHNVFWVKKNSIASIEDGTYDYPYKTIAPAILALSKLNSGKLIIDEGVYTESLDLAILKSGDYQIIAKDTKKVILTGGRNITGWTKTSGYTNIYETPFTYTLLDFTRLGGAIVFEDGNPSKPIEERHYNPLQRNLSYRLPFTAILPKTSLSEVDANAGTYFISDGKLYLHTSNSDDPNTNGFSYKRTTGAANTYVKADIQTEHINLTMFGLRFMYWNIGFVANGFARNIRYNCSSFATVGNGCFQNDSGYVETHFEEVAFGNIDGENSHFARAFTDYASMPDNRVHSPFVVHNFLWAHDCGDDGESSHEQHIVTMNNCLLEYNGDSGSRASNDATYTYNNCLARKNGWEVTANGTNIAPERGGEGFAAVNPVLNPNRKGCRVVYNNCISEENNVGFASQGATNIIILNGCYSRNNNTELFAWSSKVTLRNVLATNSNPSSIKVVYSGGTFDVQNDLLVV